MPAAAHRSTSGRSCCEPRRPDSRHGVELVDGPKGAVRRAVVEDLLRRHRADSGKLVELLERRRVQVHLPGRNRDRAPPGSVRPTLPPPPRNGTTTCWPSATGAARLTSSRAALGFAPPASRSRRRRGCRRGAGRDPVGRQLPRRGRRARAAPRPRRRRRPTGVKAAGLAASPLPKGDAPCEGEEDQQGEGVGERAPREIVGMLHGSARAGCLVRDDETRTERRLGVARGRRVGGPERRSPPVSSTRSSSSGSRSPDQLRERMPRQ